MSRIYCWSMIFPDLASPAEASSAKTVGANGFAQAGNWYLPRIECGAGAYAQDYCGRSSWLSLATRS
jgi:hypothetical protein